MSNQTRGVSTFCRDHLTAFSAFGLFVGLMFVIAPDPGRFFAFCSHIFLQFCTTAKFANKNTKHAAHRNYVAGYVFEQCIFYFLKLFVSVEFLVSRLQITEIETGNEKQKLPRSRETGYETGSRPNTTAECSG